MTTVRTNADRGAKHVDLVTRVVVALTAAMVVVLIPGVPAPVRAAVAVTFFVIAPGLAWVRVLPADGLVEQAAVVAAVSLAADVVVAEALLYAGVLGVGPVLAVLVAMILLGLWRTASAGRPERRSTNPPLERRR